MIDSAWFDDEKPGTKNGAKPDEVFDCDNLTPEDIERLKNFGK